MQRLIQNCNRIHNNYHAIANVYKNVTYIGSISCSFIIYMLLFFFNQCGSNVHNAIHHLALFKSFLLYDSSYLELLHHYIQYYSLQLLFNPNIQNCNENIINGMKIVYCLLFTPIFSNIKYYVPANQINVRFMLDIFGSIAFFYYRTQFNYYFWINNGFQSMDDYINMNDAIKNKVYTSLVSHFIFNIFCLMNVYWGYKIIKILNYKITKYIKHE